MLLKQIEQELTAQKALFKLCITQLRDSKLKDSHAELYKVADQTLQRINELYRLRIKEGWCDNINDSRD